MNIPGDKKIILFDGLCNLCNASVQFVLRHDQKEQFVFGSLQGDAGRALLDQRLPAHGVDSFILLDKGQIYTESSAALRVLRSLGGIWQLAYVGVIVPKPWRDALYRWVAAHRYRWFGKRDTCMVPRPGTANRFIE